MYNLNGEYDVKMDSKGRLRLPSVLMSQIGERDVRLVVNRGFEKCLLLYPEEVWIEKTKEVNQLNPYIKKNREFSRYFYRGATVLNADATGRILLPKLLCDFAGIKQDLVLLAYHQQIEIWAKEQYLNMVDREPGDFSALAEEVFGHKDV
ncbi:MAG: division/cell wall cluster transcriptional repressor MraZ [Saprospiraceae bacterium]|nr:division/cell wall cluster transcriptional repressor MraZ [Saprospiraceae bacterium]